MPVPTAAGWAVGSKSFIDSSQDSGHTPDVVCSVMAVRPDLSVFVGHHLKFFHGNQWVGFSHAFYLAAPLAHFVLH
jgi:hypothetical protein